MIQNPENKREIICDKHLKKIMGGNERGEYSNCPSS